MSVRPMPASHELLRGVLEGSFRGKGWQGPTLSGALRGVDAADAIWTPAPGRKSIWSHVLHAAYWKYVVRRTITGDTDLTFPRSPSNWPRIPTPASDAAWKKDRVLPTQEHVRLLDAALSLPAATLSKVVPGHKYTYAFYLAGAAAHDAYHLGQIQLLKRLRRQG